MNSRESESDNLILVDIVDDEKAESITHEASPLVAQPVPSEEKKLSSYDVMLKSMQEKLGSLESQLARQDVSINALKAQVGSCEAKIDEFKKLDSDLGYGSFKFANYEDLTSSNSKLLRVTPLNGSYKAIGDDSDDASNSKRCCVIL